MDKQIEIFKEGTYCCSQDDFFANLTRYGVPTEKVCVIPGFFSESCNAGTARASGFGNIGIVNVDCDLYESARTVLDFVTPYLCRSAIVIFDEWFQFFGSPFFGEQKAFAEWRTAHPEWVVTEFHREGAFRMSFILTRK